MQDESNGGNKKPLVLFINNVAPLYRRNVWGKYLKSSKMELHFFFGKQKYGGIKTIDFSKGELRQYRDRVHDIKNVYFLKKYLIWQQFDILKWIKKKPQTIVLLGEFNILTNWIITLLAALYDIEIVTKGHGMYGNEKGLKLLARRGFLRVADKHLVYEKHGKNILKENGIDPDTVHILFNSLDYDQHLQSRPNIPGFDKGKIFHFFEKPLHPTLIFIGRLTKVKKLDLIINAANILQQRNVDINVLFVGTGTEEKALKSLAESSLKKGSYHFFGPSYDEHVNSRLVATADLCVAPGNVGLTAIHSLSYGTPVCTHSNLRYQMPEAEAIEDGVNGILFTQDDVKSLSNAIESWILNNRDRNLVREKCYEVVDKFYNPYYQTKVLENLIEGNKPFI